jgi:protein associated with RNAse G/E
MSLFHPKRPFTISCHGPDDGKRFYIDVAHRVRIEPDLVEFVDLFLDVMIDRHRAVSEKDEHQLVALPRDLQAFARRARDGVRALIDAGDPLFDASSAYWTVPEDARALEPPREELAL